MRQPGRPRVAKTGLRTATTSSALVGNGFSPVFQLPFRFFLGQTITFLQAACKFISISCNQFEIVIGELGPLLSCSALYLHPFTLDLVPVHVYRLRAGESNRRTKPAEFKPTIRRMLPLQITPQEVKQRLDSGEKLRLVDVREPFECKLAHIEGSELIPMRSVPLALASLTQETAPLIFFCHHGMRSLQVVSWLREQGVESSSMDGGIDRWSLEIDPTVPRYS